MKQRLKLDNSKKKISGLVATLKEKVKALPDQYAVIRVKMQDLTKTNTELGFRHLDLGNISDAVMRFKMVLRWLNPNHAPAIYGLGLCRKEEGDYQEAADLFRKAIELGGGNYPDAEYALAYVDSTVIPAAIPPQALMRYLNELAPTFNEEFIGNRRYRLPELLLEAAATALNGRADLMILDLGCGTGLCGQEFREHKLAKDVTGVDISRQMLKQAKTLKVNYRPVYDTLIEKGSLQYLEDAATTQTFDAVVAASAFQYQRDVSKMLSACRKVVQPGGVVVFAVCQAKAKDIEFLPLQNSYAFSKAYLESQAQGAGISSMELKEVPLYEGCPGYICAFVNP